MPRRFLALALLLALTTTAAAAPAAPGFRVTTLDRRTIDSNELIGKNTAASLQSGLVYGFAGQVDAIVERIRGELGVEAPAIATGGLADLIAPATYG